MQALARLLDIVDKNDAFKLDKASPRVRFLAPLSGDLCVFFVPGSTTRVSFVFFLTSWMRALDFSKGVVEL